ncbi:hypothetical protein L6R46_11550 [Myxococcota bacterium]|nr:hypothetical protein [Myxococcota bacterium]
MVLISDGELEVEVDVQWFGERGATAGAAARAVDRLGAGGWGHLGWSQRFWRPCAAAVVGRPRRLLTRQIRSYKLSDMWYFLLAVSQAQSLPPCRDPATGQFIPYVPDPGVSSETVAMATRAPNGAAVVVYNPQAVAAMSAPMRDFTSAHECGHHALGHTLGRISPFVELEADCFAARSLRDLGRLDSDAQMAIEEELSAFPGDGLHPDGTVRVASVRQCLAQGAPPEDEVVRFVEVEAPPQVMSVADAAAEIGYAVRFRASGSAWFVANGCELTHVRPSADEGLYWVTPVELSEIRLDAHDDEAGVVVRLEGELKKYLYDPEGKEVLRDVEIPAVGIAFSDPEAAVGFVDAADFLSGQCSSTYPEAFRELEREYAYAPTTQSTNSDKGGGLPTCSADDERFLDWWGQTSELGEFYDTGLPVEFRTSFLKFVRSHRGHLFDYECKGRKEDHDFTVASILVGPDVPPSFLPGDRRADEFREILEAEVRDSDPIVYHLLMFNLERRRGNVDVALEHARWLSFHYPDEPVLDDLVVQWASVYGRFDVARADALALAEVLGSDEVIWHHYGLFVETTDTVLLYRLGVLGWVIRRTRLGEFRRAERLIESWVSGELDDDDWVAGPRGSEWYGRAFLAATRGNRKDRDYLRGLRWDYQGDDVRGKENREARDIFLFGSDYALPFHLPPFVEAEGLWAFKEQFFEDAAAGAMESPRGVLFFLDRRRQAMGQKTLLNSVTTSREVFLAVYAHVASGDVKGAAPYVEKLRKLDSDPFRHVGLAIHYCALGEAAQASTQLRLGGAALRALDWEDDGDWVLPALHSSLRPLLACAGREELSGWRSIF